MSNIEVLQPYFFHAHHHLYLTKMIINLKCSALRKLPVLACVQLYHQAPFKTTPKCTFETSILYRSHYKKKRYPIKKILLCENDIVNINMFIQFSILQFLSREVRGKYKMSCSLRVRNRRLRTCQANS